MTDDENPVSTATTQWGDRDQRRSDILTVGENLLVSGGYSSLRMRDVARGAGISLGTIYTYYTNKESLFVAVFAARIDRMIAALEPKLRATTEAVEAFVITTNEYREGYMVFGRELDALTLAGHSARLQPEVEQHLRNSTAQLVTMLGESLLRFGFKGDIALAMTVMWATVTGLANHYSTARQDFVPVPWDSAVRFAAESLAGKLGLSIEY